LVDRQRHGTEPALVARGSRQGPGPEAGDAGARPRLRQGRDERLPGEGGQFGIATPALRKEIREVGYIPEHIKEHVGWEALAWHTADWWRFQWEITELVEVTSARLQDSGWYDWLTRARAVADGKPV